MKRSRAALLPHPADPFMLHYWLQFFDKNWGQYVDKLYICINSPIEKEVIDYMMTLVDNPKIDVCYWDSQREHGYVIDLLLTRCQEEYVMLVEDDCFILNGQRVDQAFELVESDQFDVVGSARGSCSTEIWDRAKELWNLDYSGHGDVGPNFWPNLFFSKAETLRNTDRNFGARSWKRGEVIEALQMTVQDEVCPADTFVNTSLQLRAQGLRIVMIPQYHASPDDVEHYTQAYNLFDGLCPWVHVGSLSSGVHGVLQDDYGRPLARRLLDPKKDDPHIHNYCSTEGEKKEWERRVTFWSLFYDYADKKAIPAFKKEYKKALDRIIAQYELSPSRIEKRKSIYHKIGL